MCFLQENIGGVAVSRGGWLFLLDFNPSVSFVTAPLSLRAEEHIYTLAWGNIFSPCVFCRKYRGVVEDRGGWLFSLDFNPSVTHVTAPLSLRAEEHIYTLAW